MLADDVVEQDQKRDFRRRFTSARSIPDFAVLPRTIAYCTVGPAAYGEQLAQANWRAVAELPWIAGPERSHDKAAAPALRAARRAAQQAVECDQLPSMLDLLRSGLGMGLVREDLALVAAERQWRSGRTAASKAS